MARFYEDFVIKYFTEEFNYEYRKENCELLGDFYHISLCNNHINIRDNMSWCQNYLALGFDNENWNEPHNYPYIQSIKTDLTYEEFKQIFDGLISQFNKEKFDFNKKHDGFFGRFDYRSPEHMDKLEKLRSAKQNG